MKVAINGFGRIGRAFFRLASLDPRIEIVAINDLTAKENARYMLKYDSVYGVADAYTLALFEQAHYVSEPDPHNAPWKALGVDVVVESTGIFRTQEKARAHIKAGAKRVVISAPSDDAQTVLVGVNEDALKTCTISSNASCTTNATSPMVAILDEAFGVEKALLNTVHSYTSTQSLVDTANAKDPRRGRAAAENIIPTSTGAAEATTKVHTHLAGKFTGIATRVPVPAGSLVDITCVLKTEVVAQEINDALKKAAASERWQGIFTVTEEPLVSTDILGNTHAAIADLSLTRVADGTLVKVLAWYDNEVGYAATLLRHVVHTGATL